MLRVFFPFFFSSAVRIRLFDDCHKIYTTIKESIPNAFKWRDGCKTTLASGSRGGGGGKKSKVS